MSRARFIGVRTQLIGVIFRSLRQIAFVFSARSAIKFIVLAFWNLRSTRSPASYHQAVASESFLKTHAMAASAR